MLRIRLDPDFPKREDSGRGALAASLPEPPKTAAETVIEHLTNPRTYSTLGHNIRLPTIHEHVGIRSLVPFSCLDFTTEYCSRSSVRHGCLLEREACAKLDLTSRAYGASDGLPPKAMRAKRVGTEVDVPKRKITPAK